jgi:hypothetical protein
MAADPLMFGQLAGAWAALADGDLQLSLLRMRAGLEAFGESLVLDVVIAFLLVYVGQDDEAARTLSHVARSGTGIFGEMGAVFGAMIRGDREATDRALAQSHVFLSAMRTDWMLAWWLADGYARLGDHDAALDWLGTAIDCGFCNHRFWSAVDPLLAPLGSDPRFEALMNRAREMQRAFELS